MPDKWEKVNNPDPRDPLDGSLSAENGYLNLENSINGIQEL